MKPLDLKQFALLSDEECDLIITAAKKKLGQECVILGHHYQRDEVFKHADLTGDSLKLSRDAAKSEAKYIVFCGVHFMAEVADILSRDDQVAILPDLSAGCSMADMANNPAVQRCWDELTEVISPDDEVTPITYINSSADLKAFCGEHGGIVCTSSNAEKIIAWGLEQRQKILFFPDQHLGRNTAVRMGISLEEIVTWDPGLRMGGVDTDALKQAKIILWKGFCSVHQVFKPEHIDLFRKQNPQGYVISHPECSLEVCQKSDFIGSTEAILTKVRNAEPHSSWLVGTELNLVNRLSEEMRKKDVFVQFMSPTLCMCSTMFRIDPQHLAWVLENLANGQVVNQIQVHPASAKLAKLALNRMLAVS